MASSKEKVHLDFIKHTRLRDLLPNTDCRTDIIQIDSESTLEEASIILAKNNLLSAPVWDQKGSRYIGLLDLFDLVGFIVFSPILDLNHQKEEENYFKYKALRWRSDKVGELLRGKYQVRRNIHLCHGEESLDTLMLALSRGGAHRALLFNKGESQNPIHLFTQSNVISFLHKNQDRLGQILHTRVEELGLVNPLFASKDLITVSKQDTALAGFTLVFENQKTHAVAVTDSEGKLIANLSASDLRGITSEALPQLLLPIEDFLRRRSGTDERADKLPHPVTCSSRSTLAEVLNIVITAKVHRVWIVDSAQRPLHAITLEEVLHTLLE